MPSLKNSVGLILGAQVCALLLGYTFRAPELQKAAANGEAIRNEKEQASNDRAIALQRAQICQPLMVETPLTDGIRPFFSSLDRNGRVVLDRSRPLPVGSTICDSYGNTATVGTGPNGLPVVQDIRPMPSEEMQKILQQRGVMPGLQQFAPNQPSPTPQFTPRLK